MRPGKADAMHSLLASSQRPSARGLTGVFQMGGYLRGIVGFRSLVYARIRRQVWGSGLVDGSKEMMVEWDGISPSS